MGWFCISFFHLAIYIQSLPIQATKSKDISSRLHIKGKIRETRVKYD
jgi:hypothetical protein